MSQDGQERLAPASKGYRFMGSAAHFSTGDGPMSDGSFEYSADGYDEVTTWVYDGSTRILSVSTNPVLVPAPDYDGNAFDADELERRLSAAPAGAKKQRKPILMHTFEFRLSGSETQEQWLPLPEGSFRPAESVLALRSVRASLARDSKTAANAVNGVHVDAELRPTGIFCTAKLSDFGDGDLVVVWVEVALY
jgi:hypothetical protein